MIEKADETVEAAEQVEMSEGEIDETLKESFPASDPPQWTLGIDPHNHTEEERGNDDVKTDANRDAAKSAEA